MTNRIREIRIRQDILGSAGTGSNPTKIFTVTTSSTIIIVEVYLNGVLLLETTQYTVDNSARTVTMVDTKVFDAQTVSIFYNV